uniref:type II toxin-antitoxin system RelE/ParE family toxin n=1 Tax=Ningiella ruwaisensis TaxID=2364274 RepID=UPI00109F8466|nr:type II toxin-antitoxin system RelE/ParE family toxin [Ningiella ruwaisensis]
MSKYRLKEEAKEDLRRIYEYGCKEFGESQADEYFYSFFEAFAKIAESPLIYQSVDDIRRGYRRCPHRSDVVYYRINQDVVEIMAIIGGQDIDVWL